MYEHVLSIYLELNDSRKQATFENFDGNFLKYFSNFRATFGCIDKQLFLNLLAQSIYAYQLAIFLSSSLENRTA